MCYGSILHFSQTDIETCPTRNMATLALLPQMFSTGGEQPQAQKSPYIYYALVVDRTVLKMVEIFCLNLFIL